MRPFSFIHTADLHLDSPFVGLRVKDPSIAKILHEATFSAFDKIISLCLLEQVNFLLVSGDVYEAATRSLRAQLRFREGLLKLCDAGIHSFIVHGNHDPLEGWAASIAWPDKSYLFKGSEVESYPFLHDGQPLAMIFGISHPQGKELRNLVKKFRVEESETYQIGLLHCNVGGDTGHQAYAPCKLEDLLQLPIDYWALGHVHERKILTSTKPVVVYPGSPQGCSIKESGPRGCYLVHVNEYGETSMEFKAVDAVRWLTGQVAIEGLNITEDLLKALDLSYQSLQSAAEGRPVLTRLTLTGSGPLYKTLRQQGFLEDLTEEMRTRGLVESPFVWLEQIDLMVRPDIDLSGRRNNQDFIGDILRLSEGLRHSDTLTETLSPDLMPLFQDRRVRKIMESPDEALLKQILDEAERLCLDNLLDGE